MAYAAASRFEVLENENKELRAILATHAGQIERNKQTIYLYAGGFYNRGEREILEYHLDILEEQSFDENYKSPMEDELESIWPRTQQGILHERRLTALENKFEKREEELAEQLDLWEEHLIQMFKERDEQLTAIELRLGDMEMKINAMEKEQLERLGM
jgi:hypothetical protein